MDEPTSVVTPLTESSNKNKLLIIGIGALVLIVLVLGAVWILSGQDSKTIKPAISPENATYRLTGRLIHLTNGSFDDSLVKTALVGATTTGDINGDGTEDVALYLRQTEASSTQLFAAVALKTNKGYVGTTAIPLGVGAEPVSLSLEKNMLIASYVAHDSNNTVQSTTYALFKDDDLQKISVPEGLAQIVPPRPTYVEAVIGKISATSTIPISIKPIEVTEDSRCPLDSACVQQGSVVVNAEVSFNSKTTTSLFVLNNPVTIAGFGSIVLVRVSPDRSAGKTITPAAYGFIFSIVATNN